MVRSFQVMPKRIDLKLGERDIELLSAIDRSPLTASQLCRLSKTFSKPFTDEGNLRRRLRAICEGGLLRKFAYIIASDGRAPSYYKLTREGYRVLYGLDASMPKRRYFDEIKPGHHHHTFSLAETIVHLSVTACLNNIELLHFARENSVKLVAEPFTLYPDAAFVLRGQDGRTFSFVLEFDNGTERVRSKQEVESLERKIRGYDAHQSQFDAHDPDRYLVLFISTRSQRRLQYVLDIAAEVMSQPQRRVFVGCSLSHFLAYDPFKVPLLEDHRGLRRTVIPMPNSEDADSKSQSFSPASFCPMVS